MTEVVGTLAELPDLWDVMVSEWASDSCRPPHARELDEPTDPDGIGFRREVTALAPTS